MNVLRGWGRAIVEFHEGTQLAPDRDPVNVTESALVRIEGSWVHIDITRDNDLEEAKIVSVPSNLIARVEWKIAVSEVKDPEPWVHFG